MTNYYRAGLKLGGHCWLDSPDFHHKPNLTVDDVVCGKGGYPPSCLNATGIRGAGGVPSFPIEYFLTYNTTCTASMADIFQIEG